MIPADIRVRAASDASEAAWGGELAAGAAVMGDGDRWGLVDRHEPCAPSVGVEKRPGALGAQGGGRQWEKGKRGTRGQEGKMEMGKGDKGRYKLPPGKIYVWTEVVVLAMG